MSRATAKRKRQVRRAAKQFNVVNTSEMLEPINISEAAFTRRQAKKQQQASSGPQNLSMAWDDTSLGVGSTQTRDGLLDEKERKDTYYKVFLGNQWVSGCVNAVAKRITSGGWECTEVEQGQGNPQNKETIENLLRFENLEEDFLQFLRSIATDLLVFGEAYCELVWSGGVVVGLYMIDAISMTTHFDKHGVVTKYTQTLERSTETQDFEPEQIIRWWLPDPRAKKKALSPIEHLKDPVYLDQSMITWIEKFFKQGARPSFSVQLADDTGVEDAQRYVKFYRENYTGLNNAHIPPVFYGGAKGIESGRGTLDIDFDKGQDKQRDRVLAVYGVPPAEISIIDVANLGGGTGTSQNKAFMYNTVIPIEQIILEKFNYRVIKKGLGITDWKICTRHADYRDDNDISQIEDKGVRNGTLLINEARAARGRKAVEGGDEAVIIAGKDIVPVSRFKNVAAEQAQSAQLGIEMQQAQLDKAKQPPPSPQPPQIAAPGQQPPDQQQGQGNAKQPPNVKLPPPDNGEQDATQEALLRRFLEAFNPGQARDNRGRWTKGGGGDDSGSGRSDKSWRQFWDDFEFKSQSKKAEPEPQSEPEPEPEDRPLPTQEELSNATLQKFGASKNATYQTEIDGQQYFVKKYQKNIGESDMLNEKASYDVAKELGVEDHFVPTGEVKMGGDLYGVSPWVEGKVFAELSDSEKMRASAKLSDEEFTKLYAYEYLMGDSDRHEGNYMIDDKGSLKLIDHEFLGGNQGNIASVPSPIVSYRAKALGVHRDELHLDENALRDVVSRQEGAMKALTSARAGSKSIDEKTAKEIEGRYKVLELYSKESGSRTAGSLFHFSLEHPATTSRSTKKRGKKNKW